MLFYKSDPKSIDDAPDCIDPIQLSDPNIMICLKDMEMDSIQQFGNVKEPM